MASVSTDAEGRRRILFTNAGDERKAIRLGKVAQRTAESVRVHVENLVSASITRCAVPDETSRWVAQLDSVMLGKLARVMLIDPVKQRESMTLDAFLADYIDGRTDAKTSTHLVYGHSRRCLLEYFGADRKLEAITATDAEVWRAWLATDQKLAPNTMRRRTGIARQFFNAARKRGLITDNPFTGLAASVGANPSRFRFVTTEEIEKVIEAAPDGQWRMLIALARYGGLRVPSEALALRWGDIDWARARMTVRSSKTAHHVGGESRSVPLFPELLKHLEEGFAEAAEGDVHVITRYRDAAGNLRTQFARIIDRAGLKPWGKLWQNLRSSRETELVERFPLHAVCTWLGNSPKVASKHYLQTTEAHYREAAQNPAQNTAKPSGMERNEKSKIPVGATKNAISEPQGDKSMGEAGLEPARPYGQGILNP